MNRSDQWWQMPRGASALPDVLWERVGSFESWREGRLGDMAALAWMYERERFLSQHIGVGISAADAAFPEQVSSRFRWLEEVAPSLNIIKGAVDTLVARLFTDMAALEVMTAGAPFEERGAAQQRSMALDATMNTRVMRAVQRRIARDGLLKGFGAAWPYVKTGQVKIRRMHSWQIAVDPYDARDGEPRMLHAWYVSSRATLIASVAQAKSLPNKAEILAALKAMPAIQNMRGPGLRDYYSPYDWDLHGNTFAPQDDALIVMHAWALPGGQGDDLPEEARGRHIITVHGGAGPALDRGIVMWDDEWKRPTHPIVWWSPFPSDEGIDGIGVGHLLLPWQACVDRTVAKIQEHLDTLSYTKVLMAEDGAPDPKDALAKGIAIVHVKRAVLGDGAGFSIVPPSVLNPEEQRWLEWILASSRNEIGINTMLSKGGSQLGANAAAVALVEEDHRQLDRLADIDAEFEDFRVKLAKEVLHAIDDAVQQDGQFEAQWREGDGRIRQAPWSKLIEQRQQYVVDVERTGVLGRSKAGRITRFIELKGRVPGIPDEMATEALFTSPDIQAIAGDTMAGQRLVQRHLEILIDPRGDHIQAAGSDPHVPAQLGADMTMRRLQRALAEGAKDETIARLMAYYKTCSDRASAEAAAAAPPPQPPGPGVPGAEAMPPGAMPPGLEMMPNG